MLFLRLFPFLLLGHPLSRVVNAKVTFYQGHNAENPGCTSSQVKILTAALAEGEEAIHTAITALQHSSESTPHNVYTELFAQNPTSQVSSTLQKVLTAAKNPTSDITVFCNENHITKLSDPHTKVPVWTDTAWSTIAGKLLPQVQTSWAEADGWKNTDAKKTCELGFSAYTTGINSLPDQAQLDASKMRDSNHIMLCERFWKDVPGGNPDRKTLPQWKAALPDLLKKGEVTLNQMYPRSLSLVHELFHTELVGGKDVNGDGTIQDFAYGFPECAKLVTANNPKQSPLENADSFTLLVFALNMPGDWSGGKTGGKTSSEAGGLKSSMESGSNGKAPSQAALRPSLPKAKSAKRSVVRAKRRRQERIWKLWERSVNKDRERDLADLLKVRYTAVQPRSTRFNQQ
ncbi:hypothetical protein MMC32_000584 [Xylographa parallela]|nr:hypothetical protein [Xylographa parallela]